MLSRKSIEMAIVLARKLEKEDKCIMVKRGTLMSRLQASNSVIAPLVKDMRDDESITNSILNALDPTRLNESLAGTVFSDHDIVMNESIPNLSRIVEDNIDFARNVVSPTVKLFHEVFIEEFNDAVTSINKVFFYDVAVDKYDDWMLEVDVYGLRDKYDVNTDYPGSFVSDRVNNPLTPKSVIELFAQAGITLSIPHAQYVVETIGNPIDIASKQTTMEHGVLFMFYKLASEFPYFNTGRSADENKYRANELARYHFNHFFDITRYMERRKNNFILSNNNKERRYYLVPKLSQDQVTKTIFINECLTELFPNLDHHNFICYLIATDVDIMSMKINDITPQLLESFQRDWSNICKEYLPDTTSIVLKVFIETVVRVYMNVVEANNLAIDKNAALILQNTMYSGMFDHMVKDGSIKEEDVLELSLIVVCKFIYGFSNSYEILKGINNHLEDELVGVDLTTSCIRSMTDTVTDFLFEQIVIS